VSTIFKRGDIPEPTPPEEVVEVTGGAFIVRALPFSERFGLANEADGKPRGWRVLQILARCVLYDDRTPVFEAQQWETFATRNRDDATRLLEAALRLSGFGEPEKNG